MSRAIGFVLSPHHTATWHWLHLIDQAPGVSVAQVERLPGLSMGRVYRHNLTVDGYRSLTEAVTGATVLHQHVMPERLCSQAALALAVPTVLLVRDPLSALITHHEREPDTWPHADILAEWSAVAALLATLPADRQPLVVPTDICNRGLLAEQVSGHLGISLPAYWPRKINTAGSYRLKALHRTGDACGLMEALGISFLNLRALEPQLRPLLEAHGYRDLLWWT